MGSQPAGIVGCALMLALLPALAAVALCMLPLQGPPIFLQPVCGEAGFQYGKMRPWRGVLHRFPDHVYCMLLHFMNCHMQCER